MGGSVQAQKWANTMTPASVAVFKSKQVSALTTDMLVTASQQIPRAKYWVSNCSTPHKGAWNRGVECGPAGSPLF